LTKPLPPISKSNVRILESHDVFGRPYSSYSISLPKETDISIRVGNNTLYVSIYQARWIKRIDRRMLYYVNLKE